MSFLCENHFQPANLESLITPNSPTRSLVVIVPKLKSQLSSFENLRGIVRPQKLSEVKSLQNPKSLSMSKKRTVPQRFFNANLSLFSFSTMPANGARIYFRCGLKPPLLSTGTVLFYLGFSLVSWPTPQWNKYVVVNKLLYNRFKSSARFFQVFLCFSFSWFFL